ncbi:Ger(x)C family spore germination protein [Clostridium ganghwense]|uniref:Ger(X)C family spore germination protein n=1 Tax=Clostridium ganghwense TaxID=312089 RepID=A0ABT4CJ34_9CLOT|nr:Ger(x)C family spore germination protein [Clostridium ganghwense]
MKTLRKSVAIFILGTMCIYFSGCWNYREIDDMPMVIGVAIDMKKDNYILTTQVVKPMISVEEKFLHTSFRQTEGETLFDAIRDFIIESGKRIFWGHLKFIIVSEDIAREGISSVFDFFARDDETREDIWVLVSTGGYSAADILKLSTHGKELGFYIPDALKSVKTTSKYDPYKMYEFRDDLSLKGKDGLLPLIRMEDIAEINQPLIFGNAVFKKDKMIGTLNSKESKSLRVIRNREKGGVLPVKWKVDSKPIKITLEIDNSKTKIIPIYRDNNIFMKIDITTNSFIGEVMNYDVDIISEEGKNTLKDEATKIIKDNAAHIIHKAQNEFKSDILGFGEIVKNKMPDVWREVEDDWDNIFENISYEINVKVNIKGSALYSNPLKVEE